jgi:hypothetical protein
MLYDLKLNWGIVAVLWGPKLEVGRSEDGCWCWLFFEL